MMLSHCNSDSITHRAVAPPPLRLVPSLTRICFTSQVLTTEFLRKYLIFAKRKYARAAAQAIAKTGSAPLLAMEESAVRRIVDYYVSLRALPPGQRNFPVTPRCLETIIRLATAHCKVRLGDVISAGDVAMACALMDHVMRRDIVGEDDHSNKANREANRPGQGDGGDEDDDGGDDGGAAPGRTDGDEEMEEAGAAVAVQGDDAEPR